VAQSVQRLGWMTEVRFPKETMMGSFFSSPFAFREALEPTELPYLKNTGGCYTGVKRPACEADNSYPPSAEAKNAWS